jgi:hypothetical protein
MAQTTYIATVQVVLKPGTVESQVGACDWFSGLLSEHEDVLDWQYLPIGGTRLYPSEKIVNDDDFYLEGDAFDP